MVRVKALATFIAVLATCQGAAAAKDYQLPPSSKWVLDYAPESCQLSRAFGSGDDTVVAQFYEYQPGSVFDLNLIGKPIGDNFNEPAVRMRFGSSGNFVRKDAMAGSVGNLPALFLAARLDNFDPTNAEIAGLEKLAPAERSRRLTVTPAVEAAVTSATVRVASRIITLSLGSMGPPMAELRKCTADLVKAWGLDPIEQEALASGPEPRSSPGGWLTSSDYPQEALAAGSQAIIRYRLMISATGKVTACAVQSSIAKEDFGKLSCDLLTRRARFEPAMTADGVAVASYYVSKVLWLMR